MNPVKGLCPVGCSYCYAAAMYRRFGWDKTIRFHASELEQLSKLSKPSTIFVGSTIELFGEWVRMNWLATIFQWVRLYRQHTYIFLSKNPDFLVKMRAFPPNCWIGLTVTDQASFNRAVQVFKVITATVKFISIEPFLSNIQIQLPMDFKNINWITVGAMTGSRNAIDIEFLAHPDLYPMPLSPKQTIFWTLQPHEAWVTYLVEAASLLNIPVFIKDNILDVNPDYRLGFDRQEFPDGTARQRVEKKGVKSVERKPKQKRSTKKPVTKKCKGKKRSAKK